MIKTLLLIFVAFMLGSLFGFMICALVTASKYMDEDEE